MPEKSTDTSIIYICFYRFGRKKQKRKYFLKILRFAIAFFKKVCYNVMYAQKREGL